MGDADLDRLTGIFLRDRGDEQGEMVLDAPQMVTPLQRDCSASLLPGHPRENHLAMNARVDEKYLAQLTLLLMAVNFCYFRLVTGDGT